MSKPVRATKKVNPPAPYDGLDAYELPDGSIAFSSRGAVTALGGSSKRTSIEHYAIGMISESAAPKLELIEFETPDGSSVARGVLVATFADIVRWYADKYLRGQLRKNQEAIGKNCALLQNVAAQLGWEAMARSWFGRTLPAHEVPILQAEYFRREKLRWKRFYAWELPDALAKFFGVTLPVSRTNWPPFMKGVHRDLYDVLLGTSVANEARARRDELEAETIPQVLDDQLRDAIADHLTLLVNIAEDADSYSEWLQRVARIVRKRRGDETPFGQREVRAPEESRQLTMADLFQ